jgi:hypothetical protein
MAGEMSAEIGGFCSRGEFGSAGEMVRAGRGEDEDLAWAEEVGVAQLRIGLGDARPGNATAQLRSGEFPERIAAVDGDAWGLHAGTEHGCGDNQQGAGLDVVWIGDLGIGREEFVPAGAAAEMAAREFPEGIAGLDADFGGVDIVHDWSNRHGVRNERRRCGNWFGWEQQFRRRDWRRGVH